MGCPPPNLIHQLQTILHYHTAYLTMDSWFQHELGDHLKHMINHLALLPPTEIIADTRYHLIRLLTDLQAAEAVLLP